MPFSRVREAGHAVGLTDAVVEVVGEVEIFDDAGQRLRREIVQHPGERGGQTTVLPWTTCRSVSST